MEVGSWQLKSLGVKVVKDNAETRRTLRSAEKRKQIPHFVLDDRFGWSGERVATIPPLRAAKRAALRSG